MNAKQEILTITELAFDYSNLCPDRPIHSCSTGATGISVTAFNEKDEIDWQQNLYEWERDEHYLARLQFLRVMLEEMHKEALAERQGEAA